MPTHDQDTPADVTVQIVNAFTLDGTGGNPAGVVLDADRLDEAAMQAVAARTGLSETAFVSRSASEGARLDFFTPTRRIAHCGHATVAAFAQMRAEGRIVEGITSKETVDGPRRIIVQDGAVFMEQKAPAYETAAAWRGAAGTEATGTEATGAEASGTTVTEAAATEAEALAAIGVDAARLDPRVAPQVVDTGNRFLLIGLARAEDLATLAPDQEAIARISEALDLIGFYVFARTEGESDATARMFAPRYGIAEESATGMAAGPLACLLHDGFGDPRACFVIEQGRFMAEPSVSRILVDLSLEEGRITGLMAGGAGRRMRALQVPIAPAAA